MIAVILRKAGLLAFSDKTFVGEQCQMQGSLHRHDSGEIERSSCPRFGIICGRKGVIMPTMLKVHEAKANFSGVLSEVENNLTVITILRYGRPVAKIVPVTPERDMSPLPGFAGHVRMKGDWLADESSDWENA